MSQNQVNYGIDPSGAQLLDELLSGEQQNRLTMDGGNTRPLYAMEGTVWTDKSVENFATLKRFDGTSDVVLMTINEQTGTITIPGIADTDLSNLSSTGKAYVAIKGYNNSTVYAQNDVVLTISNGVVVLYKSLVNNNTSALTDTTKWEEVSLGGGSALPLLTHFWQDHELDDMSFLLADTFSWQDGTVYSNAYDHLVDDIDGVTAGTETVGGYTVTFYRATDGHKIVLADQETTVSNIYTVTGVAWYYVLDTVNNRFKLPRTKYGFDGLRGNVGDYISESLPNITGTADINNVFGSSTGGFYKAANSTIGTFSTQGSVNTLGFDASRSSSTYQNGAAVQERGTQMYLYFYVGQYTQSATEQTAGLNAELFNNKADIDASNFNAAGRSFISGLSNPSTQGINLITTGAINTAVTATAQTYVAPASGVIQITGTDNNYILLIHNNLITRCGSGAGAVIYAHANVSKGDTVSIRTDSGTATLIGATFRYANGEV